MRHGGLDPTKRTRGGITNEVAWQETPRIAASRQSTRHPEGGPVPGAALGVSGLSGLTIVGGAAAQGRNPWEDLPKGESAAATGLQLRTIGLGVSVQDRFLKEFERRTGHETIGKVTGLTPMITEWLAGGYANYDTNETNANRNAALWNAGLLQPIPVDRLMPWQYARDLYTSDEALGYDPVTGWPLAEIWVDPANQKEFKLVPQFFNCDSIGYRYDLTGEDIDSWGALVDPKYKGKVGDLQRQPADPRLVRRLPEEERPRQHRAHRQHDARGTRQGHQLHDREKARGSVPRHLGRLRPVREPAGLR